MSSFSKLRFRIYVNGEIVSEKWIDAFDSDSGDQTAELGENQMEICNRAEENGQLWVAEVYDPDKDIFNGYLRFGTDAGLLEFMAAVDGGKVRDTTLAEIQNQVEAHLQELS